MCCVMGYTGHDLSAEKFKEYLLRTVDRGPDDQRVVEGPYGLMGFGRLAIMGLTPEGMQPFYRGADCVVCNGELYGFRFEKEILKRRGYKFCSSCVCSFPGRTKNLSNLRRRTFPYSNRPSCFRICHYVLW